MPLFGPRRKAAAQYYFGHLASVRCLAGAIRHPKVLLDGVRAVAFDLKLRETTPDEWAQIYKDTIAALDTGVFRAPQSLDRVCRLPEFSRALMAHVEELARAFTENGSDKSTTHDYHKIYGRILAGRRNEQLHVLEIGLGTNNLDVLSNMGIEGRPGASLRAFRDWAPRARIYGADIDDRILFQEERITTFWVDQTSDTSLNRLAESLGATRFDLIIDDGLHLPHANLRSLARLLPFLSPNGYFVVEDISPEFASVWHIASRLLGNSYRTAILDTKGGILAFIVQNATR